MAIKASPATGNINASGRVTAAEFAAQSVSAFRVGSGALVEQAMPTTESSSKPISITGIVQWVRGLIGKFYEKPEGGIPKSDLVSSVQTSLNKADAAQPKIDDLNTIRERARTGDEHAGIKDGNPHNTKFSDLVAKPTTLTGYGVTAADPATVSAEGGADDNKAADAVKTKQYVEYMVGSNTARFQGEFATADDIPTDVTQYATKTAPTNNDYIVVRDMSEYGKTGNLFSSIDAAVGSINANGVIDTSMANFRHTTLLPLSGKDGWHIHLKATGVGGSAMFRLHAYKSDGSWNGQIAVAQSAGGMVELRGLVPYGTEGFRVSYLNGSSVTVFAHEREGSWRWIYTGEWSTVGKNGWSPAFQMSTEPMTPSQMEALNSGITEQKVSEIDNKRDKTDLDVYKPVFSRWSHSDVTLPEGWRFEDQPETSVETGSTPILSWRVFDQYDEFSGAFRGGLLQEDAESVMMVWRGSSEISFDERIVATRTPVGVEESGHALRSETNNICAKDGYGAWTFSDGVTRTLYCNYDNTFNKWAWNDKDPNWDDNYEPPSGCIYAYSSSPDVTRLELHGYPDPEIEVIATKEIVAASGESFVTPTGVRNIVSSDTETRTAITRLAEASIKVNHNAESTAVSSVTLKDGDVASVTMSGTTLAIDFDDARATGGLRLCELYISGATKDADLTFAEGETVVTDGKAFPKCEAGLNYYVFAEVAPNTWDVTRKTLQVVIPAPTTEG